MRVADENSRQCLSKKKPELRHNKHGKTFCTIEASIVVLVGVASPDGTLVMRRLTDQMIS